MQLTTCPSREQLSDFLSGKLSAQEIDDISSHIESCADCDTAVSQLDDDSDSLMFALRQPLGDELFEREPELQQAVAAMRLSLPASEPPASCTVLGSVREYDLLEKIGQGGMGTVYKALHSRLKRIVALKVLADHRLGDPAAVDRFSREMQAVGKLAHPNIVRALDAGEAEGRHYLVMEYIDGIDLSRLSRRCGPLPVAEASELVLQVALALQHAHEHGLVHRDIKPSNVMLTRDGNVKLLDLGIALLQPDEPATSDLTGTGQVMGTLDYMAPEQLDNTHAVDIRADVYGLGATLYKLLCGSAPATDSQSRFRLPGESIPPVPNIRTIRSSIPKPLAAVIERMLAPHPDQRYATPADVAEALKPFAAKSNLKQLALAAAADAPSRTITPPKRFGGRFGRLVIASMAVLGIALAGFAIYVETDKGQIVIHSSVDDVQVLVKRTGKLYDALDELEVDKGDNQWKFRSGSYEVQLLGNTDGLRVKDGVFTLTRDGKAVVTIERDRAQPKSVAASGPVYEGKSLDEWIAEILTDKSEELRLNAIPAVEALGADAPSKAIAALLEISSDYEIHLDQSREIPKVIQDLRVRALQAIQKLSPDAIPKEMSNALQDPDVNKRRFAAYFIRHYWKDNPPIAVVRTATKDSDEFVRRAACNWLQAYGSDAIPILIEAFKDESDAVRLAAVQVASQLSYNEKLKPEDVRVLEPKLFGMVRDKNFVVRDYVWGLLPQIATDRQALLAVSKEALRDPESSIQFVSIGSLIRMGPEAEEAIPDLVEILTTHDRNKLEPIQRVHGEIVYPDPIPAQLIRALGAIGPSAATTVPLIEEFRNHESDQIRKAVVKAIKQISGEDIELPQDDKTPSNKTATSGPVYDGIAFDEWVKLLEADKSPQRQIDGIKALVALGTDENAPRALEIVFEIGASHSIERQNDDDRHVVSAALEAIARIDDAELVRPFMLGKLDSDDTGARLFAVTVLNYPLASGQDPNYSEKTLARIYAMSADPAVRVRIKLIELLGRLAKDDKPSVPTLIQMYETDKDQQVRYDAFQSLAALGDNRAHAALPLFLAGSSSPDSKIRRSARRGLESTQSDPEQLNEALLKALGSDNENVRRDVMEFLNSRLRFPQGSPELLPVVIAAIETTSLENKGRNRSYIRLEVFDKFPKEVMIAIVRKLETAEGPDRERWHSAIVSFSQSLGGFPASGPIVDELVRLYQDADVSRRVAILQLLGALGADAKSALQLVEQALKDKDPQARAAAEEALKAIRPKPQEEALKLIPPKPQETGAPPAPKTSDPVFDGRTFEEWVAILKSNDRSPQRRVDGFKALGALHTDENADLAIQTILAEGAKQDLHSNKEDERPITSAIYEALRQIGYGPATPHILAAIESEDVKLRRFAATLLSSVKLTEEIMPKVLKLTQDEDDQVRQNATLALRYCGDAGLKTLISMIQNDPSQDVRVSAARSLGFLQVAAHSALPALLELYKTSNSYERTSLLESIKGIRIYDETIQQFLRQEAASDDERVGNKAQSVAQDLMTHGWYRIPKPDEIGEAVYNGKTFDEWIVALKSDKDPHHRRSAIQALGYLKNDEDLNQIIDTLITVGSEHSGDESNGGDKIALDSAAGGLSRIYKKLTLPKLLAALASEQVTTRRFATIALARLKDLRFNEEQTAPVLKLAGDPDEQVRLSGVELLFNAGDEGRAALVEMIKNDSSKTVRMRAAEILALLKERAAPAIPAVLEMYESSNSEERSKLLSVLGRIGVLNDDVETLLRKAADSDDAVVSYRAKVELHEFGIGELPTVRERPGPPKSLQEQIAALRRNSVKVTIQVTADGKLTVGDKSYDTAALKELLAEHVKQSGAIRLTVSVDADPRTSAATILSVTNACRDAGVRNIYFGPARIAAPANDDGALEEK